MKVALTIHFLIIAVNLHDEFVTSIVDPLSSMPDLKALRCPRGARYYLRGTGYACLCGQHVLAKEEAIDRPGFSMRFGMPSSRTQHHPVRPNDLHNSSPFSSGRVGGGGSSSNHSHGGSVSSQSRHDGYAFDRQQPDYRNSRDFSFSFQNQATCNDDQYKSPRPYSYRGSSANQHAAPTNQSQSRRRSTAVRDDQVGYHTLLDRIKREVCAKRGIDYEDFKCEEADERKKRKARIDACRNDQWKVEPEWDRIPDW